jgi:hypothetical protein
MGGVLIAAIAAAVLATTAGAVGGDAVQGTGVFTLDWPTNSPFVGYQVRVSADTRSDADGANAGGRFSAALTKKGASNKGFQVNVNCMSVVNNNAPSWTSYHVIFGGAIRGKDKDGYQYAMFHVWTNAIGNGVDQAGIAAYPDLGFNFLTDQPFANACDEAAGYGDDESFNLLTKGSFAVTDN